MSDEIKDEVEKLKREKVISEKTAQIYISRLNQELSSVQGEKAESVEDELLKLKNNNVVGEKTAEIYLKEFRKNQ